VDLPPIPELDAPLVGQTLHDDDTPGGAGRPAPGHSTPPPIPGLLAGRMLSPPAISRNAGSVGRLGVTPAVDEAPTPETSPTLTPEPSFTSEVNVGNLRPGTRPDSDDDAGRAPSGWMLLFAALAGVLLIGIALTVVGAGVLAWYLTG
jgi:hypothetical protein